MLRKTSVIALVTGAQAMYCGYPQWGIPGAGDEFRCDWEEGCSLRAEEGCVKIGVFEGEQCEAYCANDESRGTELWECVSGEEWKPIGKRLKCGSSPPTRPGGSVVVPTESGTAFLSIAATATIVLMTASIF